MHTPMTDKDDRNRKFYKKLEDYKLLHKEY